MTEDDIARLENAGGMGLAIAALQRAGIDEMMKKAKALAVADGVPPHEFLTAVYVQAVAYGLSHVSSHPELEKQLETVAVVRHLMRSELDRLCAGTVRHLLESMKKT